jgi:hypothetical protein
MIPSTKPIALLTILSLAFAEVTFRGVDDDINEKTGVSSSFSETTPLRSEVVFKNLELDGESETNQHYEDQERLMEGGRQLKASPFMTSFTEGDEVFIATDPLPRGDSAYVHKVYGEDDDHYEDDDDDDDYSKEVGDYDESGYAKGGDYSKTGKKGGDDDDDGNGKKGGDYGKKGGDDDDDDNEYGKGGEEYGKGGDYGKKGGDDDDNEYGKGGDYGKKGGDDDDGDYGKGGGYGKKGGDDDDDDSDYGKGMDYGHKDGDDDDSGYGKGGDYDDDDDDDYDDDNYGDDGSAYGEDGYDEDYAYDSLVRNVEPRQARCVLHPDDNPCEVGCGHGMVPNPCKCFDQLPISCGRIMFMELMPR